MKRSILVACLTVFLTQFNGCIVFSFYPFYLDENIVDLPEIQGKWKLVKDVGEAVNEKDGRYWEFTEDMVETCDEKDILSKVKVVYFKINDFYFADFAPGDSCDLNKYANLLVYPVHTVLKVKLEDKSLKLIPLNMEKIGELIKDKKINLSYLEPKQGEHDNVGLYTVKSEIWTDFLATYGHDNNVFNEEHEFLFVKMPN